MELGAAARRAGARQARRRHRSRSAHSEPHPHREVAGGDRPGARDRRRDPGPRRTDREPARRRGRAPVCRAAPAARAGGRHDLRLAPPRRSVRDRGPDGRAARRPRRGRAGGGQHDAARDDPLDRRARAVAGVQAAAGARGRAAADPVERRVRPGRPDRLPSSRGRDRRSRGLTRGRAGDDQPRPVRRRAVDGRQDRPRRRDRRDRLAAGRDGARRQPRLRRPRRRVDHAGPFGAGEPLYISTRSPPAAGCWRGCRPAPRERRRGGSARRWA